MGNRHSDHHHQAKDHHHETGTKSSESQEIEQQRQIVTEITTKELFTEEWKISVEDKELLHKSWDTLRSNLESMGVVTLLKMFETHPETLRAFMPEVYSVKEVELNEWYHEKLRVHALRVMSIVEKTMHRLNDETKAALILVEYGHRHKNYGVTLSMLELMGKSFVLSIQDPLAEADCWNSKMERAWSKVFSFITFFMRVGYGDEFLKCQKDPDNSDQLNLELIFRTENTET